MTSHPTSRPWIVGSKQLGEWPIFVDGGIIHCVGTAATEADAHHIVHCVNLHDELVAALQNLVNGIETGAIISDHDETFANAISKARNALAKDKAGAA